MQGVVTRSRAKKLEALKKVFFVRRDESDCFGEWDDLYKDNYDALTNLMNSCDNGTQEEFRMCVKQEDGSIPRPLHDYFIKKFVIEKASQDGSDSSKNRKNKILMVMEKNKNTIIDLTLDDDDDDSDFGQNLKIHIVSEEKKARNQVVIKEIGGESGSDSDHSNQNNQDNMMDYLMGCLKCVDLEKVFTKIVLSIPKEKVLAVWHKIVKKQEVEKCSKTGSLKDAIDKTKQKCIEYKRQIALTSVLQKKKSSDEQTSTKEILNDNVIRVKTDVQQKTHKQQETDNQHETANKQTQMSGKLKPILKPNKKSNCDIKIDFHKCNGAVKKKVTFSNSVSKGVTKTGKKRKMSDNTEDTIRHYKKRLIQQHETPKEDVEKTNGEQRVKEPMVMERIDPKTLAPISVRTSTKENIETRDKVDNNLQNEKRKFNHTEEVKDDGESQKVSNGEKMEAIRKRRKSRSHFRHDALEFIKLGDANSSTTLCKTSVGKTMIKSFEQSVESINKLVVPKAKLTEDILNKIAATDPLKNGRSGNESGRHNLPQIVERRTSISKTATQIEINTEAPQPYERHSFTTSPSEARKSVDELIRVVTTESNETITIHSKSDLINSDQTIGRNGYPNHTETPPVQFSENRPTIRVISDLSKIISVPERRSPQHMSEIIVNRRLSSPNIQSNAVMDLRVPKPIANENLRLMGQPDHPHRFLNQIPSYPYQFYPTQQRIDNMNRNYPMTPEPSPTTPSSNSTQFTYHQPKVFSQNLRPLLPAPRPVQPIQDNTPVVKRPRGRPRLHNNTKPRKPVLRKPEYLPPYYQSPSYLVSPPNTPITKQSIEDSLLNIQLKNRSSPERRRFSNNFGDYMTNPSLPNALNSPSLPNLVNAPNFSNMPNMANLPNLINVPNMSNLPNLAHPYRPDYPLNHQMNTNLTTTLSVALRNRPPLRRERSISMSSQLSQQSKRTDSEIVELSSENEDPDTQRNSKKSHEVELNKIIQETNHVGFTPESFDRMKSIYCDLQKSVLDKGQYLSETYKNIIQFNMKLVNQYQNTFLKYCSDELIKQIIPQCGDFFRKFVDKLMTHENSFGSWNFQGEVHIVLLEKENKLTNLEIINLQEKCKNYTDFIKNNFLISLLGEPKCNEDILFGTNEPSIIVIVDKYGNWIKTTYSGQKNFLSIKLVEIIVLNDACTQEIRRKKERLSISSDDHSEHMTEQISNIIETLGDDGDKVMRVTSSPTGSMRRNFGRTAGKNGVSGEVIEIDSDDVSRGDSVEVVTSTSSNNPIIEDISDDDEPVSVSSQVRINLQPRDKIKVTHKLPINYSFDTNDIPFELDSVMVDAEAVDVENDRTSPTLSRKSPKGTVITKSPSNSESKLLQERSEFRTKFPKGKLCYLRRQNMLLRYYDNAQANLFFENLERTDQTNNIINQDVYRKNYKNGIKTGNSDGKKVPHDNEVIKLPSNIEFSDKETLENAEEYIQEFAKVEAYVPDDFFLYYKYVTGYQIYRRNIPISFQTFLTMHNTNGLKMLLTSYIQQLERLQKEGNT